MLDPAALDPFDGSIRLSLLPHSLRLPWALLLALSLSRPSLPCAAAAPSAPPAPAAPGSGRRGRIVTCQPGSARRTQRLCRRSPREHLGRVVSVPGGRTARRGIRPDLRPYLLALSGTDTFYPAQPLRQVLPHASARGDHPSLAHGRAARRHFEGLELLPMKRVRVRSDECGWSVSCRIVRQLDWSRWGTGVPTSHT